MLDGTFQRDARYRITRDEEQIYEGELVSLRDLKMMSKKFVQAMSVVLYSRISNDVKEEDKASTYYG